MPPTCGLWTPASLTWGGYTEGETEVQSEAWFSLNVQNISDYHAMLKKTITPANLNSKLPSGTNRNTRNGSIVVWRNNSAFFSTPHTGHTLQLYDERTKMCTKKIPKWAQMPLYYIRLAQRSCKYQMYSSLISSYILTAISIPFRWHIRFLKVRMQDSFCEEKRFILRVLKSC